MIVVDCGRIGYERALALQHELVSRRSADQIDDALVLCEHDPVYTAGRHADVAANLLDRRGLPLIHIDRGGDITYHGPGQVVIYPIVQLTGPRQVRSYVTALEHACIAVAAHHGVEAHTDDRRPGVWVGNDKLAAIGVRVRRGATSHGLAFNVAPDLTHFAGIVPCGITDAGVCSLASLGVSATFDEVAQRLTDALSSTLGRPLSGWTTPPALGHDDRRAA